MLKITTRNSSYYVDTRKKVYKRENHTKGILEGDGNWLHYLSISEPKVGDCLEIIWEHKGRMIRRSTSMVTQIENI